MNLRQGNIKVQESGLKFNKLPWYYPHMVAYSRDKTDQFLYGMSYLVKTECGHVMLLGDINISRLMTHAQQVEGDNIREQDKEDKQSRTGNYDFS